MGLSLQEHIQRLFLEIFTGPYIYHREVTAAIGLISMANGFLQVDADAGIRRWSMYEPFRMARHDEGDEPFCWLVWTHTTYSKME